MQSNVFAINKRYIVKNSKTLSGIIILLILQTLSLVYKIIKLKTLISRELFQHDLAVSVYFIKIS